MKITYMGTAAAEGVPALFCQCDACQTAKREKGKNIRSRMQTLINDDLLIDFPPDTFMHMIHNGLDLDLVQNILITHTHEDHLFAPDISYRMDGYCGKRPPFKLNIYSDREVYRLIDDYIQSVKGEKSFYEVVNLVVPAPFTSYAVGEYTVYPLLADHNPPENCYMYIVQDKQGKTLLYAHDTGYFPQQTWDFLKNSNFLFDFISLDCTSGWLESDRIHMGMSCCKRVRDTLCDMGLTHENTLYVVNHFSHNGLRGSHEELEAYAHTFGFTAAFDNRVFIF